MRQVVCDYCGKTDPVGMDWLKLKRPHPDDNPGGGIILVGGQELDFHTPTCVIEFLKEEMKQQAVTPESTAAQERAAPEESAVVYERAAPEESAIVDERTS